MKWVREDFLGDSVETAKKLIGAVLVHRSPDGITAGRIVECEAYGGIWRGHEDDGAHAFKGLTPRTELSSEKADMPTSTSSMGCTPASMWCAAMREKGRAYF